MSFEMYLSPPRGHTIGFARPLSELIEHINNDKMPSLRLLARTIKVIVLAIFRWHLCDHIFFPSGVWFCHSMRGRFTHINEEEFKVEFPFMRENAIYFEVKTRLRGEIDREYIPPEHSSLTAQAIVEFYRVKHHIELTNRKTLNTISSLFSSKELKRVHIFA